MNDKLEIILEQLKNMHSYLDVTRALITLDEVADILKKMEKLAERATEDSCSDEERAELQKIMDAHIARIDSTLESYNKAVREDIEKRRNTWGFLYGEKT